MNERAVIGGNNPPSPIDEITGQYEDAREEAAGWLDGAVVETEGQMGAVDKLRKAMRDWRLSLEKGQKAAAKPLYDEYKAELDRWKPEIEDAKRHETCLVAAVDAFKRKLAEKKRAEEKAAWEAAEKARRDAEAKARAAAETDLEAQREAAAARQAAIDAERAAQEAKRGQVKGLRTVTKYEIESHKAALHWIAANDKEAMTDFIEEYVRRNHKARTIEGVRVWQDKEAY